MFVRVYGRLSPPDASGDGVREPFFWGQHPGEFCAEEHAV